MFDHPLVRVLVQQRDIAMNNWAVQAVRVAELEARLATLQQRAAATDLADHAAQHAAAGNGAANGEMHEELSP